MSTGLADRSHAHWARQQLLEPGLLDRARQAPLGTTLDVRLENPSSTTTFRFLLDGAEQAMAHVQDLCPRALP